MNNYLVTGVAGFIGSKIAEHFIKNNIIVVGLDNLSTGYKNIPEKLFFQMDCASKSVRKIFKKYKIDAVIHFAGQTLVKFHLKIL